MRFANQMIRMYLCVLCIGVSVCLFSDGDFMKKIGSETLTSIKKQYAGTILPSTHPVREKVLL